MSDLVDELGAKPFALWDIVPASLRGVLLNIRWDRDALFRMVLPVEEVPVAELRWQLALPWWRVGDRYFAVSPEEVRADPDRYAGHWQRTLAADLAYPIHVVATTPVLRILDGVHRLLKADTMGQTQIRTCRVDRTHLAQIAIRR